MSAGIRNRYLGSTTCIVTVILKIKPSRTLREVSGYLYTSTVNYVRDLATTKDNVVMVGYDEGFLSLNKCL